MDNKQLTKLATVLAKRREKRAFLGGLARLVSILSKSKAGLKLIPRATQMSKEMPSAFKLLTNKNVGQMLGSARMPGFRPPPGLPSMVGKGNIKRLQQLAKEMPDAFKNINRGNINQILPRRGGINIPGMKPPALPSRMPSRLPPPPPISTRVPNPNFRPQPPGSSMWRSPGM